MACNTVLFARKGGTRDGWNSNSRLLIKYCRWERPGNEAIYPPPLCNISRTALAKLELKLELELELELES